MKSVCFALVLEALTGATGLFWRNYITVSDPMTWYDAQTFCRRHYVDLSTINSQEELYRFNEKLPNNDYFWSGLRKTGYTSNYSQWSDGDALENVIVPQGRSVSYALCVYTYHKRFNEAWCMNQLKFSCYTWEPRLVLVQEMKTWDEALEHCRTFYMDLISVRHGRDLLMINNQTKDVQTLSFWTGLRFLDGSSFWVNGEPLMKEFSLASCPAWPFRCGAKTGPDVFENRDCEEKMNFMCYSKW